MKFMIRTILKYFNIPNWIVSFSTLPCSLAAEEFLNPVFHAEQNF